MSLIRKAIGDNLLQSGLQPRESRHSNKSKQTKMVNTNAHPNSSPWGDNLLTKASKVIRIALRNINYFPINVNDTRNLEFVADINEGNFDIYGLTETNVA